MSKQNGGSAFPQLDAYVDGKGERPVYVTEPGMTLRQYYEAKAMAALIAACPWKYISDYLRDDGEHGLRGDAQAAAETMLRAREES